MNDILKTLKGLDAEQVDFLADCPICDEGDNSQSLSVIGSAKNGIQFHCLNCRTDSETIRSELEKVADENRSDSAPFKPLMKCLADIEPKSINWLWPQRIAAGRITLAVGMPGAGKSFLTCDLASRISTGTTWPDGSPCEKGSVIFITAEDDPHDTIRPRLDAHDADVKRIHLLSGVIQTGGNKSKELAFSLSDVDVLRQALREIENCRLVVIDPIGSFLGGRCDAHRDNEVRSVLTPIAKLAEEFGPAVLMVAHRRKSQSSFADDTALGSRAFTGIARSVWHLSRDTENRDRRLLLPGKSNVSAAQDGLAFTISGNPASVCWESGTVDMTADDALSAENAAQSKKPGPKTEALEEAITWLKNSLANGPREANALKDEWKNGQDGSEATLKRAKTKAKVQSFRDSVPGPWKWRLSNRANPSKEKELGPLDPLEENTGKTQLSEASKPKGVKFSEPSPLEPVDDGWGEL